MSHLIVFDLEATCWEAGCHRGKEMETIEIGAVKANMETMTVIAEFSSFVHPVRHAVLSPLCRELTSIRQEDVDRAVDFPAALNAFNIWIRSTGPAVLASWGAYDPKQLMKDCRYHGIVYPLDFDHINLKQVFSERHDGRKYGMKRALRILGLKLEGAHHRALDDARNIGRIYRVMKTGEGI